MSSPTDNFQVGNSGNNASGGSIPSPDSQTESQPETKPKAKRVDGRYLDRSKSKRTTGEYQREYDLAKYGPIIVNGLVPKKTTDSHFQIFPMPVVNDIELRPGKPLTLNHKYSSLSWLIHQRGEVQEGEKQCGACEKGVGPYTKCIMVPGVQNNCCSNCAYDAQLTYCSLRTDRKPDAPRYPPKKKSGGSKRSTSVLTQQESQSELEVRDGGDQDQQPTDSLDAPHKKARHSKSLAEKNAPESIKLTEEQKMHKMSSEVNNMSLDQLTQHRHSEDMRSYLIAKRIALLKYREAQSWLDTHMKKAA
ncbi:hypothetical protein HYFRA_00005490 [Hymenoscyphus fraxineus]|uniref:Uncharacterized protein n=1 Tax=Hymenoscyphus fraxineus TaxID=746836 RepID=A0A9N9KT81_9HELO|nr:hypothetical protein HYFRA_00005490 [Hymenoscyphus fraxineus]